MKTARSVRRQVVLLVISLIVSVTLFAFLSKKASAKDLTIGTIEYKITAFNICNSIEDGDNIKVLSGGGNVIEAMEIAACIRKKDVLLEVERAFSAATFIVLAGKKICFSPETPIGFHSPHRYSKKGLMVMAGINELRDYSQFIGHRMKGWGYTDLEIYTVIGITLITPSNDMLVLPYPHIQTILGKRFIGECK